MQRGFVEPFPFGKRFSIALIDDTDGATLAAIKPIYSYLAMHHIRVTKTVWAFPATDISGHYAAIPLAGDTLASEEYRRFCQDLQRAGFEIALHTASAGNSKRDETIAAYQFFEEVFGHAPYTNIMHARNRENIYWGKYVVSHPLLSRLIALLEPEEFAGHKPASEYYWGDICREKTRYVRLFETLRSNTLAFDPATPYHDANKPDVNWWFSASYGSGIRLFSLLTRPNINKLAQQRGASIIHLYLRHYMIHEKNLTYKIHPAFYRLVPRLDGYLDGWYVPVVELLDRLRAIRSLRILRTEHQVTIHNGSSIAIADLAVNVPEDVRILSQHRQDLSSKRNSFGQVPVGTLGSGQTVVLNLQGKLMRFDCLTEQPPNYARLLAGHGRRILWQWFHGRRRIVWSNDSPWVQALSETEHDYV